MGAEDGINNCHIKIKHKGLTNDQPFLSTNITHLQIIAKLRPSSRFSLAEFTTYPLRLQTTYPLRPPTTYPLQPPTTFPQEYVLQRSAWYSKELRLVFVIQLFALVLVLAQGQLIGLDLFYYSSLHRKYNISLRKEMNSN